jgi:hypothetical protein
MRNFLGRDGPHFAPTPAVRVAGPNREIFIAPRPPGGDWARAGSDVNVRLSGQDSRRPLPRVSNQIAACPGVVAHRIADGTVEVAGYAEKERLITEAVVPNSSSVKERLKTDGSVRNAGWSCSGALANRRTGQKMMIMKYSLTLLSICAVFGVIPGRADEVLPPRFNFDRYSAMVKSSPFAIATAVALPAATPNFAKDLYVANAAHSPEGDMATIASSSDQNFKKYLTTREPVDGYSIASIEWSDRVGATKVTISKDGKFATLTFNQALLAQQAPPNARRAPGQPNRVAPPSMPRQARTRGMIQRNPKPVAVPTPNLTPVPTPTATLPAQTFVPDRPSLKPVPTPNPEFVPDRPSLKPVPTPNPEPPVPGSIDGSDRSK